MKYCAINVYFRLNLFSPFCNMVALALHLCDPPLSVAAILAMFRGGTARRSGERLALLGLKRGQSLEVGERMVWEVASVNKSK
jgi:hypothetical protein